MGNYSKSNWGVIRGQIGEGQALVLKGQKIVKSMPTPSTKPPTSKQLVQRSKFGLVTSFMANFSNILDVAYLAHKSNESSVNAAVSYHILNAIKGEYPAFTIDYPKVILSAVEKKSTLDPADNTSVTPVAGNKLEIKWESVELGNKLSTGKDKLYLVFYCPGNGYSTASLGTSTRDELSLVLPVPRMFIGQLMHGWILFVSPEGDKVSLTTYLGTATPIA